MRGTITLEIMTPMEGMHLELPRHKLSPDMLAAGSFNVVCDSTGILRARAGYSPISSNPGPQNPLTGGIAWEGNNGAIFTIIADNRGWWIYGGGINGSWTPMSGSAPVRDSDFTQFAALQVSGTDNLYGVNNNPAGPSGLYQWIAGTAAVVPVAGLPFQSALDCLVLNNRLVVFGTVEGGVSYPQRVRWSEFNQPTVFGAANINDLADPGGGIAAAIRQGNLQAFIYMQGTEGIGALQQMSATGGNDANAFNFQEFGLGEGVPPPASVASIVSILGIHYYVGQDNHIWTFNGIAPQNFGIQIQADLADHANLTNLKHSFVTYDPAARQVAFWYPSTNATYCDRCVYYSLDFLRWESPAQYTQEFRIGFTGPLDAPHNLAAFLGGVNGGLYQIDQDALDLGAPIPFAAVWGVKNVSAMGKMQVRFAEAFLYHSNIKDVVVFTVSGLRTPADVSVDGIGYILQLSEPDQFQQMSDPGIDSAGNRYFNWLQPSLMGTVSGSLQFLGAYIQVNESMKGVQDRYGDGPE